MRYQELDFYWKRIFELEWMSLCEGSKAIAALIVSDDGTIISEGRNKVGEESIPNPRVSHVHGDHGDGRNQKNRHFRHSKSCCIVQTMNVWNGF